MDLKERAGGLSTISVYTVRYGHMPAEEPNGVGVEYYLTTKWTLRFLCLQSPECSKHSGRSFP